jgi:polar amino acid transport system substrate-binding protein
MTVTSCSVALIRQITPETKPVEICGTSPFRAARPMSTAKHARDSTDSGASPVRQMGPPLSRGGMNPSPKSLLQMCSWLSAETAVANQQPLVIDRSSIGYLTSTVLSQCAAAFFLIMLFIPPAPARGEATEVRVAAYVGTPFVIEKNGSLTGFSIDLWNAIAAQLNVKTRYQIMSSGSALEQALRLRRIDVVASPVVITLPRYQQFDFSLPILQAGLQIMVRYTGETANRSQPLRDLLALLFSRTALIWLGIALVLVLIPAHVVWLLERRYKDGIISSADYFPGIFEAIYWALSCLSTQAETQPRQWIARTLAVLWMFVGIVFVASYTAQLTTTLTVQQIKDSINGPQDLPGKEVAAMANSVAADYLRMHGARVQLFDQPDETFRALLNKEVVAVLSESPIVRYYAAHDGKGHVQLAGTEFNMAPLAMVLQLNSPLRRKLDLALLTLEQNGSYRQLYNKWFGVP